MLYHLISKHEYDLAKERGLYAPESLESEGFIHFSTNEQVDTTAKRFYFKQKDLLLLEIDPNLLKSEVKFEPADNELFPHLYGELNMDAIENIYVLSWDDEKLIRSKKPS